MVSIFIKLSLNTTDRIYIHSVDQKNMNNIFIFYVMRIETFISDARVWRKHFLSVKVIFMAPSDMRFSKILITIKTQVVEKPYPKRPTNSAITPGNFEML